MLQYPGDQLSATEALPKALQLPVDAVDDGWRAAGLVVFQGQLVSLGVLGVGCKMKCQDLSVFYQLFNSRALCLSNGLTCFKFFGFYPEWGLGCLQTVSSD